MAGPTPAKKAPAKKAATKKAAPAKKAAASGKSDSAQAANPFLYKVPDGWEYNVDLTGPDGTTLSLGKSERTGPNALDLTVVLPDGTERVSPVGSMPEGLRAISSAAKSLDKVAQREKALNEAREESLSFLGASATNGSKEASSDPGPEPKDASGSEPKDESGSTLLDEVD